MFPTIDFNVRRIENICQELDAKNRELESTLKELKKLTCNWCKMKKWQLWET